MDTKGHLRWEACSGQSWHRRQPRRFADKAFQNRGSRGPSGSPWLRAPIWPIQQRPGPYGGSRASGGWWETRAVGNHEIVRQHHKPRLSLFTPMKVAGGPYNAASVGSVRVTVGKYADEQTFCKVDQWKVAMEPHQKMERPRTGTIFFLKQRM